ncbi:MAG: coproporphyrinogen III oxidase family protein [Syntrophorhabdaceae bacterium]|nr:coproporphyrinogen III oxidase family protein [Syntrophorhabdaceae bacterium]
MLIENFITWYARKKNEDYVKFAPSNDLTLPERTKNVPTLLYLHIPFCEELCPYCSFNRVVFKEDLCRGYYDALRREISMYKERGYDFQALYVGGGTPTVLMDELKRTVLFTRELYPIKEISVETNPNHLTEENIGQLKEMGVNRLSVGVQTFDDGILKSVERYHKYGSGREIGERLKRTQGIFDTLNADMIFNFPTQTLKMLENDLHILLSLQIDQITYYPLMVSTYTQEMMRKKLGVVNYERGNRLYSTIMSTLKDMYKPSTAWCFSRTNKMIDEYVVHYDEYAGLGSGSIGYLGGCAYANTFDIRDYINEIRQGRIPIAAKKEFTLKERLRYDLLMKLFGLSLDLVELKLKHKVNPFYYLFPEILFFRLVGGIKRQGSVLRLTEKGQYYWVLMMREFFIGVNNFRDYCRDIGGRGRVT